VELEGAGLGSPGRFAGDIEPVEVLRLLWTAGWLFQWGTVTSNRIEGRISQVKLYLPPRGRNSEEAVNRRLAAILSDPELLHGINEVDPLLSVPSSPHLGFVNLGSFITPKIEAMEVIRA